MRLIDADALIEKINSDYKGYELEDCLSPYEIERRIDLMPTIEIYAPQSE